MNRIAVLVSTLSLIILTDASAGTLRIGNYTVEDTRVTVPVVLGGEVGDGVAALNFQLSYDPAVLKPMSARPGNAATTTDKQVMANMSVAGQYNVVMMGFNQNTITSGEVVRIVLGRVGEPAAGRSTLRIARTTLSSLEGVAISSRGSSKTIAFGEGAEEEAPDDGDPAEQDATGPDRDDTGASGDRPVPNGDGETDAALTRLARLPGGWPQDSARMARLGTRSDATRSDGTEGSSHGDPRSSLQAQLDQLASAIEEADRLRAAAESFAGEPDGTSVDDTIATAPEPEEVRAETAMSGPEKSRGGTNGSQTLDQAEAVTTAAGNRLGVRVIIGESGEAAVARAPDEREAETSPYRGAQLAILGLVALLVVGVFALRGRLIS